MGFRYFLDLDELSDDTKIPVSELKRKTFEELEQMSENMKKNKNHVRCENSKNDPEYVSLIRKYFRPISILTPWFSEKEIVFACAECGINEQNLCEKFPVRPESRCPYAKSDYLRTSVESVPQYDSKGRELMERAYKKMDVYRVPNRYQGTCHGRVILKLLYGRYPELETFGFSAYEYSEGENYEIYTKNHIYVPLAALMSGNVDAVRYRILDYLETYNNRSYTEQIMKALRSNETKDLFRTIRSIGARERENGHFPFIQRKNGTWKTVSGLDEAETAGDIRLFWKTEKYSSKSRFLLHADHPFTALDAVNALRAAKDPSELHVCIAHEEDYNLNHAVNILLRKGTSEETLESCSTGEMTVTGNFGWTRGSEYHLILRTDDPDIRI